MNLIGDENILIITLDSCRWDSFEFAKLPVLKSFESYHKAYAQGTYTLPAHISIYSGILPNSTEELPYFNRFKKNLFRISYRQAQSSSLFNFPKESKNIIHGFKNKGYNTFGVGAMSWFKHPLLNSHFDDFLYSGINIDAQITYLQNCIALNNNPFFAIMNIGETHEPYKFGGNIEEVLISRARMRAFDDIGFLKREHEMQIESLEYVDGKLKHLFDYIQANKRPAIVVVCGDHGECFGEDGLYGHGFYHPKVMEVPLCIFKI